MEELGRSVAFLAFTIAFNDSSGLTKKGRDSSVVTIYFVLEGITCAVCLGTCRNMVRVPPFSFRKGVGLDNYLSAFSIASRSFL